MPFYKANILQFLLLTEDSCRFITASENICLKTPVKVLSKGAMAAISER